MDDDYLDLYLDYSEMLQEARDENARLRELLRELYEDQCDDGDKWRYRDRMRKLGIEVER